MKRALVTGCLSLSLVGLSGCLSPDEKKASSGAPTSAASATPGTAPASTSAEAGEGSPPGESNAEKPGGEEARRILAQLPPKETVEAVVNPRKLAVHVGKSGTVRGVVRSTGDVPLEMPQIVSKIEAGCKEAVETFRHAVREGEGRTLADVFVAVTGYDGYVPPKEETVVVEANGCAYSTRTIGLTFGQNLRIVGKDRRVYVPEILGLRAPAQLFVMPSSPTLDLPPGRPGRYKLLDSMRLYNVAELLVVPYATFAVTKLDGRFSIDRIPVGKVKVSAFHPTTGAVVEREIEVQEGKPVELDLELPFRAAAFESAP